MMYQPAGSGQGSEQVAVSEANNNNNNQQSAGSNMQSHQMSVASENALSAESPIQQQNQQHHQQQQQQQLLPIQTNRAKRNPFCSRCRNHGMSALVKGHKRHCDFRECQCKGCLLVEQRQKISAAQIKLRREQKQDEESGRQIKISPPVLPNNNAHNQNNNNLSSSLGSGMGTILTTTPPLSSTSTRSVASAAAAAAALNLYHTHTHHQLHPHPLHLNHQQQPHHLHLNRNHHSNGINKVHHHQQQHHNRLDHLQHNNNNHHHQQQQQQAAAAEAALSNVVLQTLANFPNCMLPSINNNNNSNIGQQSPPTIIPSTPSQQQQQQQQLPHLQVTSNLQAGVASLTPTATSATTMGSPTIGLDALSPTINGGDNSNNSNINININSNNNNVSQPITSPLRNAGQIQLVEMIHSEYGPLAVYAWLKAEDFNAHKILTLIEMTRDSFDELLQMNGHSPLDLTNPIVD